MSLIQSIIASAIYSVPTGPSAVGTYSFNGTPYSYGHASGSTPNYPANPTIWFPGGQQGGTLEFDGTGWEMTQDMGANDSFFVNLWIYPTLSNREIMSETNGPNVAYYYNMLEVDGDGYIHAGIYTGVPISSVTSTNKVTLNAWNHIYFYFDASESGGTIHLEVNGGTAATLSGLTRNGPGTSHFVFGLNSATNMGSATPYSGYVDTVEIYSSLHGSNYEATKDKYQAKPVMALLGSSYGGSGPWVDSVASKSFTLYGSPTWSNTNGGQFRFDKNSSQYAECSTSIPLLSSFTIQAVFKIHSNANLGACLITEKWPGITHINYAIGFIESTTNLQAGFFSQNEGFWAPNIATAITTPMYYTWYDVVVSYYGPTRELKTYLNGTLVSTVTALGNAVSDDTGIRIARRWDDADYLDCTIKDINIWRGVLTPTEIANQHTPYNSLT